MLRLNGEKEDQKASERIESRSQPFVAQYAFSLRKLEMDEAQVREMSSIELVNVSASALRNQARKSPG